jgi:hypothetical protein
MKKLLIPLILGTLNTLGSVSILSAKTWVCDAESATGFDSDRGFTALTFMARNSYIIRDDILPSALTHDYHKDHEIFQNSTEMRYPASITKIGSTRTELCIHHISEEGSSTWDNIVCDTVWHGDVSFNVEIGRYSLVENYFSSGAGSSWVEVGECRRTN